MDLHLIIREITRPWNWGVTVLDNKSLTEVLHYRYSRVQKVPVSRDDPVLQSVLQYKYNVRAADCTQIIIIFCHGELLKEEGSHTHHINLSVLNATEDIQRTVLSGQRYQWLFNANGVQPMVYNLCSGEKRLYLV